LSVCHDGSVKKLRIVNIKTNGVRLSVVAMIEMVGPALIRTLRSSSTVGTIRRADVKTSMIATVLRALEAASVEFIDGNGGGPGVRLRKPIRQKR